MRVSTLFMGAIVVGLIALAVVFSGWLITQLDFVRRWKSGFTAAESPTLAAEKFRDAIQQRRYGWAATYCTRDYAEVLVKCDTAATRLGTVIDQIREYMKNKELQTDQVAILLNSLDPFPSNFRVSGAIKTMPGNDKEAVGSFVMDQIPGLVNPKLEINPVTLNIDAKMYQRPLVAPALFASGGVKIVKEGEAWKLDVPISAAMQENVRYFLDHAPAYESELSTFRTYMTNGRYDSPKAFEAEVLEALKKAKASGP